jgi:nitroreductase
MTGAPLEALKAAAKADGPKATEYPVYPENLWDPFRTRRFVCGEDLYASIGIPREDRGARFAQLAKNLDLFGAPVGLFFCIDRSLGAPQWSDLGMFMQTVMLLATERGLDTCAQEFWARFASTVGRCLALPEDHMVFSGMALGYLDTDHPINGWRTRREPFDAWCEMRGFED